MYAQRHIRGLFFFNVAREIDFIIECCPQVGFTICSKPGMLDNASPDSERDSKILGRVQSRAHLSGRPAVHKGEGQMGAQPGVKMASADQGKQIYLPSDQSLGRERVGSSSTRHGPAPDSSGAQDLPLF